MKAQGTTNQSSALCFTMIISCFLVEILVKSKAYAESITPSLSSKATNTTSETNASGAARHTRSVHMHRTALDAVVFRCRTFPQEAGEKELQ